MTKVNKVPFSFDVEKKEQTKEKIYFFFTYNKTTKKELHSTFEQNNNQPSRYLVAKVVINLLVLFLKSDKENSLSFIMTFWKEKFQST